MSILDKCLSGVAAIISVVNMQEHHIQMSNYQMCDYIIFFERLFLQDLLHYCYK